MLPLPVLDARYLGQTTYNNDPNDNLGILLRQGVIDSRPHIDPNLNGQLAPSKNYLKVKVFYKRNDDDDWRVGNWDGNFASGWNNFDDEDNFTTIGDILAGTGDFISLEDFHENQEQIQAAFQTQLGVALGDGNLTWQAFLPAFAHSENAFLLTTLFGERPEPMPTIRPNNIVLAFYSTRPPCRQCRAILNRQLNDPNFNQRLVQSMFGNMNGVAYTMNLFYFSIRPPPLDMLIQQRWTVANDGVRFMLCTVLTILQTQVSAPEEADPKDKPTVLNLAQKIELLVLTAAKDSEQQLLEELNTHKKKKLMLTSNPETSQVELYERLREEVRKNEEADLNKKVENANTILKNILKVKLYRERHYEDEEDCDKSIKGKGSTKKSLSKE